MDFASLLQALQNHGGTMSAGQGMPMGGVGTMGTRPNPMAFNDSQNQAQASMGNPFGPSAPQMGIGLGAPGGQNSGQMGGMNLNTLLQAMRQRGGMQPSTYTGRSPMQPQGGNVWDSSGSTGGGGMSQTQGGPPSDFQPGGRFYGGGMNPMTMPGRQGNGYMGSMTPPMQPQAMPRPQAPMQGQQPQQGNPLASLAAMMMRNTG